MTARDGVSTGRDEIPQDGADRDGGAGYDADTPRAWVWRLVLGTVGVGGIAYGVGRILQSPGSVRLLDLGGWLLAALVLHDGILAPAVTVFGFLMARLVPGRARAFLQGGLLAGALVCSFTVVEIAREGHAQPGNALLVQHYGRNLVLVLAVIAVLTAVLYATRVVRERRADPVPTTAP